VTVEEIAGLRSFAYVANCSTLFTEHPLLSRPAAARRAGFDAIEFWWPFEVPVPTDAELDRFVDAVVSADVHLAGLNFFAADLSGPDAGVLSIPGRSQEFRDNVSVVASLVERLGIGVVNALYGNRVEGVAARMQDELATENLAYAANAIEGSGATVLVEMLSGPKPYPIRTADDAAAVVDRLHAGGVGNIGILLDIYHLASNGDDIEAAITRHASQVSHVQIADSPGRGEPGSGGLDLMHYLTQLREHGYAGGIGLEYKPTTTATEDSLGWLEDPRGTGAQRREREERNGEQRK
jgi:hydroxypyruvate isomerase